MNSPEDKAISFKGQKNFNSILKKSPLKYLAKINQLLSLLLIGAMSQ